MQPDSTSPRYKLYDAEILEQQVRFSMDELCSVHFAQSVNASNFKAPSVQQCIT